MRHPAVLAVAVAMLLVCLAACTEAAPQPPPSTTSTAPVQQWSWRQVRLPDGVHPVTAVDVGSALLVGGYAPRAAVRPRLTLVSAGKAVRDIPVRPDASSPYAPLAAWTALAWDGRHVVAVGGAPGGAHANTRWTTWQGDLSVVREAPQSFYVFGGYGAGALVGVAPTAAGAAVVGAWDGTSGLDAAVWTQDSRRRWVRRPSSETALASSPTELVGVVGAAGAGDGVLLTGSVTALGSGSVRRRAAVWRSRTGVEGFVRLDLPQTGTSSDAVGGDCDARGCVVSGRVDNRLALWWVPFSGAPVRVADTPDLAADPGVPVAAPTSEGDRLATAVGDRVVTRAAGRWSTVSAPADPVREVHLRGAEIDLIGGATPEVTTLWTTGVR